MSTDRFNELASEVNSILDQNNAILKMHEADKRNDSMGKDRAMANRDDTLRKLSLWCDTH
jgi:hypothetical protein